jgi:hypothetical protein
MSRNNHAGLDSTLKLQLMVLSEEDRVYLRPYGRVLDDVLRDEPLAQLHVALHLGIGLE